MVMKSIGLQKEEEKNKPVKPFGKSTEPQAGLPKKRGGWALAR
jgi:hypothetical protein